MDDVAILGVARDKAELAIGPAAIVRPGPDDLAAGQLLPRRTSPQQLARNLGRRRPDEGADRDNHGNHGALASVNLIRKS